MVVLGSMIRRAGDHPQSRPVIERAPAGQAQASLLARLWSKDIGKLSAALHSGGQTSWCGAFQV